MQQNLYHSLPTLKAEILTKADRCVKCGLCSAQCPTYLINQSENESPRGRISLMQAVASEQLEITPSITKHINNCLSCGRCEKICPSGVEFDELMASMRHVLNEANPNAARQTVIKWLSKRTFSNWKTLSRVIFLARKLGLLSLFSSLKPIEQHINQSNYRAIKTQHAESVTLFTGCTSQFLDAETVEYAVKLLDMCGFSVSIPENQVCCGALPYHKGYLDIADQCKQTNQNNFDQTSTPILHLASACGVELKKYDDKFSARVIDINGFLASNTAFQSLPFKPLKKRLLIHIACTAKNKSPEHDSVEALLAHIPDAEIIRLKESTSCCGAAGDYMMTHQNNAKKIRALTINDIIAINPDIVISSNYTCGINLENGLREKNLDIPVVHPIKLLCEQVIVK